MKQLTIRLDEGVYDFLKSLQHENNGFKASLNQIVGYILTQYRKEQYFENKGLENILMKGDIDS